MLKPGAITTIAATYTHNTRHLSKSGGNFADNRIDMQENTNIDLLANIPLFEGIGFEERASLARYFKKREFKAGEHIVYVGVSGQEFYIVNSGQVAVTLPNDKGQEIVLTMLNPGQFFGEIALLDGGPRTASARAEADSELLELSRDDFYAFLMQNPKVAIGMMAIQARRQRETNEKLRNIKNANEVFEQKQSIAERASERIATTFASNTFLLVNLVFFAAWIVINVVIGKKNQFDDAPTFPTLGFIITLESILLSMFVLASQKLQSNRDRVRADLEYNVNVKAQLEVTQLHQKVDRLEDILRKSGNKAA